MSKEFVPYSCANAAMLVPDCSESLGRGSVPIAVELCSIGNWIMQMTLLDLIKATIACGGLAFVVYSYPALSQALIIGLLTLMWFSCAHQVIKSTRR